MNIQRVHQKTFMEIGIKTKLDSIRFNNFEIFEDVIKKVNKYSSFAGSGML